MCNSLSLILSTFKKLKMKKILILLVVSLVSCTDHTIDDLSSKFVGGYVGWSAQQFFTQTVNITITARDNNHVDFLYSSHWRNFGPPPDKIINILAENVSVESRGDTLRLNNDYVRNGVKGKITGTFVRPGTGFVYYDLKAVEKGSVIHQENSYILDDGN
jgi:hypothetical protein